MFKLLCGDHLQRWSYSGFLGAAATCGLGLLMVSLVAVEYEPEEKFEVRQYEINPVPDGIVVRGKRLILLPYEAVETPPQPHTGYVITDRVIIPPVDIDGDKDIFDGYKFDIDPPKIVMAREYGPIFRQALIMPRNAERSGHCNMLFDVSPKGQPYNIETLSCSETIFRKPSERALQAWKYNPRFVAGKFVSVKGVETKITYKLHDENGQLIPE